MTEHTEDNPQNSNSLIPKATTEFDAVEHPLESEHTNEEDDNVQAGEGEENDNNTDEDTEEEGGEYEFQFQGEMDPLAFAEDEDESGMQPYQRFEKIQQNHYELLAANKRRNTSGSNEMPASKKLRRQEEEEMLGASFEEIMESMNYGMRRKSRRNKQRGRRKGSKKKANSEVTRKLGDATLQYALEHYDEAICILKEVIRLSPNLSDPYHTLGLIYNSMGDKKRSFNFYMIAAHLTPKDASLWKLLVTRAVEQGDKNLANYCLSKAITADPEDIGLRFHRATLFLELGEYQKAADVYDQISRLTPDDVDVLSKATELYKKCGQHERAVSVLEGYLSNHVQDADLGMVDLLASLLMETNAYAKALKHIEHAQHACCVGKQTPLFLTIKAGICYIHLRQLEKAEAFFNIIQSEDVAAHPHLIIDIADSLMTVEQYECALKYYKMLEGDGNNGYLHLKIARCYASLKNRAQAIEYYYKAIQKLGNSVDARLTLSALLLEEGRDDEAISVLSPPEDTGFDIKSDTSNLWWHNGKIKLKLSQIYKAKGSLEAFADVIFPVIRETLFLQTVRQKVGVWQRPSRGVGVRPRLSRCVLSRRMKVLAEHQTDTVFHGFRPVASSADLSKAARAKKLLRKKDAVREAEKAAALAAGIEWKSDDSEDESPQVFREPPLPDLLKDDEHHHLIVDLCKSLSSLQRYWDALEIINFCRKLASNTLSYEIMEELRTLGAQIAYNISDPASGWECVRQIINRHPYNFSAWNCCYKVILRNTRELRSRDSIHRKFLLHLRTKHRDCVPPILISAHLFTMIGQYQAAAREYLEAYKLMPDNPLINLCVGTALINLASDFRLHNKHTTLLQGLSFLYNNSQLCEDSQESLYNIARAYHQMSLFSLAAKYYEKVLAIREKDYPVPVLPNENQDTGDIKRPGYCDLRREAAYNLHLIYKESGAVDLARQVLRDHVVL